MTYFNPISKAYNLEKIINDFTSAVISVVCTVETLYIPTNIISKNHIYKSNQIRRISDNFFYINKVKEENASKETRKARTS